MQTLGTTKVTGKAAEVAVGFLTVPTGGSGGTPQVDLGIGALNFSLRRSRNEQRGKEETETQLGKKPG